MTKVSSALFLPLVLSLVILGCGQRKESSSQLPTSDAGLRAILGIKAFDAVVTLPAGEDYYAIGTQVYEDGKMTNESLTLWSSAQGQPNRSIRAQFLWGEVEGRPTEALMCEGSGGRRYDPFWTNVMAGSTYLLPGQTPQRTPDGSLVLGFASSGLSRDGKSDWIGHSSFATAIADRKQVGALIVKTFKSEAEQKAYMRKQGTSQ